MGKSKKAKSTPDRLAKVGKKSGVELSEDQLGQAAGGTAIKTGLKYDPELLPAV